MHIFLYGPSGSGKSTVGEILAESLAIPFLDLDTEIEKTAGCLISDFITEKGIDEFRDTESTLLAENLEGDDTVFALGGGTLLREGNRKLIEECGQVVFLDTDFETLVGRLSEDTTKRPLLEGKIESSLKKLLDERQNHYASFKMQVDASRSPEETSWMIQKELGRFHLHKMGAGYDVLVQRGALDSIGEYLKLKGFDGTILLVSDSNVAPIYAEQVVQSLQTAGFSTSQLVIPAGEQNKTIETVSSIWRAGVNGNLDRGSTIIALGGGVVSDLAGFAAATFMRGCKWVAIPTTLLAMVDASIGGKTGFDIPEGKNLAGAFYPPRFVLADPDVLSTLPEREICAGLAEAVKHGVIADPDLFQMCSQGLNFAIKNLGEITRLAIAVKIKVIEEDPFEQNVRAMLNFGHTVGHAIEIVSNFQILHGEAVAIGMIAETKMAERLSIAESGLSNIIAGTLSNLNLPVDIPGDLPTEEISHAMTKDKKKSKGIVHFALPERIGSVRVGVEIENLASILEESK